MTKTKMICTLGPATSTAKNIKLLIKKGMDVVRLNFSHGSHENHLQMINLVKKLRQETKKNIGILQDLCGPKIRVGNLPKQGIILKDNDKVALYAGNDVKGDYNIQEIPIQYKNFIKDIENTAVIMLDDGLIELLVEKKNNNVLFARIIHGGRLYGKKGVNFPNQNISVRAPTQKDLLDLEFGLKNGVDFIALSFVQDEQDIINLKKEIEKRESHVSVIAKIERGIALKNLEKILAVSDGVMVARGDLGIETDIAMIPIYQQLIIKKCNLNGIPVITATQMLDSMIRNPIPTRAEVTDVANAIYNGSDAIMLSGETAIGEYPVQTTDMMRNIADNVEKNIGFDRTWVKAGDITLKNTKELAIAKSVCQSAEQLKAKYIIAHTISGKTAKYISMYRPKIPIIAVTPLKRTYYQLSLMWGVEAVLLPQFKDHFMDIISNAEQELSKLGYVKNGDLVVISAGLPTCKPGATNVMKIHIVGEK